MLAKLHKFLTSFVTRSIVYCFAREFEIDVHVLPGGKLPQRQTTGAIGWDAYCRAIVSATEMSKENPLLRKTLFDFLGPSSDENITSHTGVDNDGWYFDLMPGKHVLLGIGFITRMKFPMFFWVAPRSGLASKYAISVGNAPGTVDPDYRGEAGVILRNHGDQPFRIRREMRIVQIVFGLAMIPNLQPSATHEELLDSVRGSGGFGSTGLR